MARSHQYRTGLIHYSLDFACRGYTLYCGGGAANLIDMDGRIVHRWTDARGLSYAQLLPNGHVLCRAVSSPHVQGLRGLNGQAPSIFELDWDGRCVWQYHDEWLHHDQHRLPNGHTLALTWRWLPEAIGKRVKGGLSQPNDPPQMLADVVLDIDAGGQVAGEWRSWEHLDVDDDVICPIDHRLEWTHANSLRTTPDGEWLISFRRTSTVAVIDPQSGAFRWKWKGQTSHQHDAKILPNGNLLVFDNGCHRLDGPDYSRVLEVDRAKNEIVWEYHDEPAFHFYSLMAGGAERLRNGNTLICDSAVGRFFEVTTAKEIVWEYVNPFYTNNPRLGGQINIVFRAHRHYADEPALAQRDLDPARYANLNRLYAAI